MIIAHRSLQLLGSSDPPASASQMAGTRGISHCTWLKFPFEIEVWILCWWKETSSNGTSRLHTDWLKSGCPQQLTFGNTSPWRSACISWPLYSLNFFLRLSLSPRLECNGAIQLTAISTSRVQAVLLPQPPE